MVKPTLIAMGLVLAACISAAVSSPRSASAATGPVYTVMNTSETLPDGVWFRNSPHTADTNRVTGLGPYMNEQVQLECYAFGDAVGRYNDSLWYFALDISRPTVDGMPNQGYLNAHYINDGQKANVVDAGVPACQAGSASVPPPPSPAVTLVQGSAASSGYWYDISVQSFPANSTVTVTCFDSVGTSGFRTFSLSVDGSGNGATADECRSNDGPDHWVDANDVESNHVSWTATTSATGPRAPQQPTGNQGTSAGGGSTGSTSGPTTCANYQGQEISPPAVAAQLYNWYYTGLGKPVVVDWSYFSNDTDFVHEAKSLNVGQEVQWRAPKHADVINNDMFWAFGTFTISRELPNCYVIYDHYDFAPDFSTTEKKLFTIVTAPSWAAQVLGAHDFDVRATGNL